MIVYRYQFNDSRVVKDAFEIESLEKHQPIKNSEGKMGWYRGDLEKVNANYIMWSVKDNNEKAFIKECVNLKQSLIDKKMNEVDKLITDIQDLWEVNHERKQNSVL